MRTRGQGSRARSRQVSSSKFQVINVKPETWNLKRRTNASFADPGQPSRLRAPLKPRRGQFSIEAGFSLSLVAWLVDSPLRNCWSYDQVQMSQRPYAHRAGQPGRQIGQ